MQRPPSTTTASPSDFRSSGWKEAACRSASPSYFSRYDGLCTAAVEANAAGFLSKAKVLWLLGDACCLRLDPLKLNEPLSPVYEGTTNEVRLDNFREDDLAFLASILPEIDDALVRARVADVLWLVRKPRDTQFATIAVDAYRGTPLDGDSWFLNDSHNCWRRAIFISKQVRALGEKRLAEIEAALHAAIDSELDAGDAAPSMIETLLDYGLAQDRVNELAERLIVRANCLLASASGVRFFVARNYLSLAKRCFNIEGNKAHSADMDCAMSQSFVDEAESRMTGGPGSNVIAASFYADAVKALLAVPRALRKDRGIDEKIKSLRQIQRHIAEQSMGDFAPMEGEAIDIGDEVRATEALVSGKELLDALLALTECWPLTRRKLTEDDLRKRMQTMSFSRIFASQKLAEDGRVIAKSPPAGDSTDSTANSDKAVWAKMVEEHAVVTIPFAVQCAILPAVGQLAREHLITHHDLVNIVGFSRVVPSERVGLVAKGLKAGFDGDFIVALHLLVPQLEHLVRTHLQLVGAKTVSVDGAGLQMEIGLSALVDLPEMNSVFGEDLAFEIRAVFCDRFGPNLRNDVAHGLLVEGAMQSTASIYAWWLMFRAIFHQYYFA